MLTYISIHYIQYIHYIHYLHTYITYIPLHTLHIGFRIAYRAGFTALDYTFKGLRRNTGLGHVRSRGSAPGWSLAFRMKVLRTELLPGLDLAETDALLRIYRT